MARNTFDYLNQSLDHHQEVDWVYERAAEVAEPVRDILEMARLPARMLPVQPIRQMPVMVIDSDSDENEEAADAQDEGLMNAEELHRRLRWLSLIKMEKDIDCPPLVKPNVGKEPACPATNV